MKKPKHCILTPKGGKEIKMVSIDGRVDLNQYRLTNPQKEALKKAQSAEQVTQVLAEDGLINAEEQKLLDEITPGTTISYQELAHRAASPRGARAVGGACSRNPLPLRLPCHRVVATDGGLGGFTGDLRLKAVLLAREAVENLVPESARP